MVSSKSHPPEMQEHLVEQVVVGEDASDISSSKDQGFCNQL